MVLPRLGIMSHVILQYLTLYVAKISRCQIAVLSDWIELNPKSHVVLIAYLEYQKNYAAAFPSLMSWPYFELRENQGYKAFKDSILCNLQGCGEFYVIYLMPNIFLQKGFSLASIPAVRVPRLGLDQRDLTMPKFYCIYINICLCVYVWLGRMGPVPFDWEL